MPHNFKKFVVCCVILYLGPIFTAAEHNRNSLLRPKGSAVSSDNDILSSNSTCPGHGTCISKLACREAGGIRKMGYCPNSSQVCCRVLDPPKCGTTSTDWVTEFMTPDYPLTTNGSTDCVFNILPLPGVCALKMDFKDVVMKGSTRFTGTRKCITDSFLILNIPNSPAEPHCDLRNYSAIVWLKPTEKQKLSPVKFLFVIQSLRWKVHFKVTQVACSGVTTWKNEPLCGRQLMYEPDEDDGANQLSFAKLTNQRAEKALIANGQRAEAHEFPWQVSIESSDGDHRCGASIIRPNLLLTANHCFNGVLELDQLSIRLGTGNGSRTGDEIEIESIVQHYEYKSFKSHLNDISIIRLKKNLTYSNNIQPICLPEPGEIIDSGNGVVSGWGMLSGEHNASSPTYLQKLGVQFISNSDCSERMIEAYAITLGRKVHVEPIHSTQLCAIAPKNSTVCFGDSGGPLVTVNATDGTYRQVGVVSYGIGRCNIKDVMPVVYTRVSEYHNFISIAAQY